MCQRPNGLLACDPGCLSGHESDVCLWGSAPVWSFEHFVGDRHAHLSVPVGKGGSMGVSVRVFATICVSVCIRIGQHVYMSMKVY